MVLANKSQKLPLLFRKEDPPSQWSSHSRKVWRYFPLLIILVTCTFLKSIQMQAVKMSWNSANVSGSAKGVTSLASKCFARTQTPTDIQSFRGACIYELKQNYFAFSLFPIQLLWPPQKCASKKLHGQHKRVSANALHSEYLSVLSGDLNGKVPLAQHFEQAVFCRSNQLQASHCKI